MRLFDDDRRAAPAWTGTEPGKDADIEPEPRRRRDPGRDDRLGGGRPGCCSLTSTTPGTKKQLEKRFKNPKDPLKLVIVRDMWLTGFDVPCLHTMYVDKPMRDHNLMQAIARVNRVFRDKEGGLVVDYIGIAAELRSALKTYTESQGKGQPTLDTRRRRWPS